MARKKYKRTGGGLLGLIDRYKNPLICILTVTFILAAYSFACADDMKTRKMQTERTEIAQETHENARKLPSQATEEVSSEESWENLGEFTVTAYCGGACCCGVWADKNCTTASGAKAVEGVTVAADTSLLPFGTEIRLDGSTYIVQDTGGAVKGNRLDLYFDSHDAALKFGVQKMNVEKKK